MLFEIFQESVFWMLRGVKTLKGESGLFVTLRANLARSLGFRSYRLIANYSGTGERRAYFVIFDYQWIPWR